MATVNKDFKVKAGLVVEGANATVGGNDVLTKATEDQNYIIGLIGGSATEEATPDSVVLRDENGSFAANVVTADLVGDVTGTVSDISNHDTGDLSEGTNKYFTDQRALDATSSAYDAAGSAATAESNAATDATTKANAAQAAAEATASADATTKANAAQSAAESFATSADTALYGTVTTDIATAKSEAISAAASDATTKADAAESNSESYTDSLIGDATVDGTGGNTVTDRIASAVSSLVDSSPEALDTLNELAAALGDDPNFATTVSTSIGTKVSKTGDTMTGDLTLAQDPTSDLHAATKQYVDDAETDAVDAANLYTDGRETAITTAYQLYANTQDSSLSSTLTAAFESYTNSATTDMATETYVDAGDAATLLAANNYADALTTTDIAEGSNEYFTAERAQDAVATAIAAGTHENITITYDDNANSISFVAENGVADSDTDDLAEGATNLYFTDTRAVDALEAVVPNFTEIDVNDLATQVAAASTGDASQVVAAYTFATADYRSAKFLVKVAYGSHTQVSEVLLTLDTSDNISITEYAVVGTNGDAAAVSADVSGSNVRLLVTPVNNTSTITVMGTLLK